MWQNVNNWWTQGRYIGVLLYNHFNFSVTMKFVKIKGWGDKKKIGVEHTRRDEVGKLCESISIQCDHVDLWQWSAKGKVTQFCHMPCRLYSPLNSLVLSLCFIPSIGICSAMYGPSRSGLKLRFWNLLKENWLCIDGISGEKYWIANWMLCCMINFLKCWKCILITLVAFKCVLQLNLESSLIALPKVIWITGLVPFVRWQILFSSNLLIVCLRLLLCWGWYWLKNAADTYILVSCKAARL